MLLYVLLGVILINLIVSYKVYKSIIAPPFLFSIGFLAANINAIIWRKEWDLDLLPVTFWILAGGISIFTLSFIFFSTFFNKNIKTLKSTVPKTIKLSPALLILAIIFQCLVLVLKLRYVSQATGYDDYGAAISETNSQAKFGEGFSLPSWLVWLNRFENVWGWISIYLGAKSLVFKEKKISRLLYLLNIIIFIILETMTTGTRGGSVVDIIGFGICYYIFWKKKNPDKKISLKLLIISGSVFVIIMSSWSLIASFIGRQSTNSNPNNYVTAIYCGAEIKNLELFLTENQDNTNNFFARQTLNRLYGDITRRFKLDDLPEPIATNDFRTNGKYMLGNVYTTFFDFVADFGIYWFWIPVAFMALFFAFLYAKVVKADIINNPLNLWVLFYATIGDTLILSFFHNKFYFETFYESKIIIVILWIIFKKLASKPKAKPKTNICQTASAENI